MVVPTEEALAESAAVLDRPETFGELRSELASAVDGPTTLREKRFFGFASE
jgi:hypothetical protein